MLNRHRFQIDTSIWVGDLTPEVDDFALYRYFTQRYGTVRCAKVHYKAIYLTLWL